MDGFKSEVPSIILHKWVTLFEGLFVVINLGLSAQDNVDRMFER